MSYQNIKALYIRLSEFVKPFWKMLFIGLIANVVYSCIDAGFTYLMRPFLDKGLIELDVAFVKTIPLVLLAGITLRGLVSALSSYCMTSVARSVVTVLRQQVFKQAIQLPAKYVDQTSSSYLVSKMLYDVEQVAQVSADALTDLLQNGCLIIGLLIVMFVICWQLSLIFLLIVPFVGFIVNKTNRRVRRISHTVQQTMGEVTECASDAISGYRVVRLFGAQAMEMEKFNQATNRARQNDMKVAVSRAINVAGVQFIIALGISGIIVASILLAQIITITAGGFLAIMAAMLQLIKPMKTLTTLNTVIQRGLAGAESVFQLLDEPIEPTSGKIHRHRVRGQVIFDQVSYAYRDNNLILEQVSFQIEPGETVALVGHSGSGKSTIASLLPRFYSPQTGRILIDGEDIQGWALQSLRKQIAMVSQEVVLFNDTVANNIAYGQANIQLSNIKEAARMAFADQFIEELHQQYQTRVGEKGVMLSGGQRQRLAIARAILKNAPILILDEATSALDTESEFAIQQALERVTKGRTTLVIAHRLSTITHADRILVMHQGKIVEQGGHSALMKLDGYYAQLIRAQSHPLIQAPVAAEH